MWSKNNEETDVLLEKGCSDGTADGISSAVAHAVAGDTGVPIYKSVSQERGPSESCCLTPITSE